MLRKQYQLDVGEATLTISETRDNQHVCLTITGLSPEPVAVNLDYQAFSALCETRYRLTLNDTTSPSPTLAIAA